MGFPFFDSCFSKEEIYTLVSQPEVEKDGDGGINVDCIRRVLMTVPGVVSWHLLQKFETRKILVGWRDVSVGKST